jgi:hypothetical protein
MKYHSQSQVSISSHVVYFAFNGFLAEILKGHRQHFLYTQYQMLQVPLMTKMFEERFGSQVMCTCVV